MDELLKKLVEGASITGFEDNVADILIKALKPHVNEVKRDRIGNVIARKGTGSPKIMLAAHMDKIGLIVKFVNDKGFIMFDKLGGWDERIMPAMKVIVHGTKGPVMGVIGSKPVHIQEREEQKKPYKMHDMFIDIGAASEGDVKKAGISVGDFITIHGCVKGLLGSRITGHGFDNRVGCSVLVNLAKGLHRFKGTLYLVGTVKEEIGLIGVRGATFGINPDAALAIDTCIAGDTPGLRPDEAPISLGSGPALLIKDAMSVIDSPVKKWVVETAKKNKISIQFDVASGGATDGSVIPTIREGVPGGAIAVPVRYIHSPVEVADVKDIDGCVKLCVKLIESASGYF